MNELYTFGYVWRKATLKHTAVMCSCLKAMREYIFRKHLTYLPSKESKAMTALSLWTASTRLGPDVNSGTWETRHYRIYFKS